MTDPVEQLAFIVPLVSIAFVFAITSINVYIRFRRRFAATVNCWFCNQNTQVAYDNSNSWDCPHCLQYNGFTKDGDYNKDIPAQRVSRMNQKRFAKLDESNPSSSSSSHPAGNGFCAPCNRNQELKMQQLASFVPANEQTFDTEVEAYRRKLDQAYRLCPRCERQLKRALTRVKQNVLGSKLAEIGAKGINAFDLYTSTNNKKLVQKRKRRLTRLFGAILIVLAVCNAIQTFRAARFTRSSLDLVFPSNVTSVILVAIASISLAKGLVCSMFSQIINSRTICVTTQWILDYWTTATTMINLNYLNDVWKNSEIIIMQQEAGVPDLPGSNNGYQLASIAAVLLSVFVVWTNHYRRASLVMLLLWSIKCVFPITFASQLRPSKAEYSMLPDTTTAAAYSMVVLDLVQIVVDLAVLISSSQDAFTRTTTLVSTASSKNSSFHRIYAADSADELSDDSDMETTLSSTRSHTISNSYRSSTKHSPRRTPRHACSSLNNSTLSISPSAFTPSTLHPNMTSSNLTLNRSFYDNNINHNSNHNNDQLSQSFDLGGGTLSSFSSSSLTPKHHSKFQSMQTLNRIYDIPEEFQNGINQLNIGERSYTPLPLNSNNNSQQSKQQFGDLSYLGSQTSLNSFRGGGGNTPFDQKLRYRTKSIIEPSRLQMNYNKNITPEAPSSGHQAASWIAGGYWNQGLSPTKRTSAAFQVATEQQLQQRQRRLFIDVPTLLPVMSRTSSQSSGFVDSHHENDSRESSVGPPTNTSPFGDTFSHTITPSDSVSQCGQLDYQSEPLQQHQPLPNPGGSSDLTFANRSHLGINNSISNNNGSLFTKIDSETLSNGMRYPNANIPNYANSSYSTRHGPTSNVSGFGFVGGSLFNHPPRKPSSSNMQSIFGRSNTTNYWPSGTSTNPNPNPPIRPGSLLKSWADRNSTSQLDLVRQS